MDRGPQYDVKMRVGEGLTIFTAMKVMFTVSRVSLVVKRELFEIMVAPLVTFGVDRVV